MLKFGTSGIRGVFNKELDLKAGRGLCYALGQNFFGKIGLGYDTRESSRVLANYVLSGLSYYGNDVTSFGVLPTPVVAFITRELGFEAGLMLTASHNPPEYSGIKVFDKEGIEIDSDIEKKLERDVTLCKERTRRGKIGKTNHDYTVNSKYIEKIMDTLPDTKGRLKILVDCGNGATTEYTPKILTELGHQVITVNSHQSAYSLGRVLEPNTDTLKKTAQLVKATHSDLGIAHDGDGDRTVIIDEEGRIVEDQVFSSLTLKVLLKEKKRGRVVVSVNTSYSVERSAEKMGFRVTRARLGKTFLEMKRMNGVLAIEPSKVTDASWGIWEDGVYVATKVAQYISTSNEKLSDIINRIPNNFYYQRNLSLKGIDRYNLQQTILSKYRREKIESIDGWKIVFKDKSSVLYRISGTEPKARIYVDSTSNRRAVKLLEEGIGVVESVRKQNV